MVPEPDVSVMFPLIGSVTRRLASLHRIPRGSVLRLRRYYQGAPTPAAHPVPLPFVRRAVPRTAASREAAGSCCFRFLVGTDTGASILCLRSHSWRRAGSPRFLGNPFANMLCSSTPADRTRQAHKTHPMLPSVRLTTSAPRSVTFRGSISQPVRSLSTLHGSDYSDHTAQDSLPADGHS